MFKLLIFYLITRTQIGTSTRKRNKKKNNKKEKTRSRTKTRQGQRWTDGTICRLRVEQVKSAN